MIVSSLSIEINSLKLKRNNEKLNSNIECFNALEKKLKYNSTAEEIKQVYSENKMYINKENFDMESIEKKNNLELFSSWTAKEQPYIKMEITDGDVMKINLIMFYNYFDKQKSINSTFYKGKYEE